MIEKKDPTLLKTVKAGNIQGVLTLLSHGAKVDTDDDNGTTALMFAANLGYTEIVRSLLAAGANINLTRKIHGLTALMLAANSCQVDVVKLLVSQGANINATNHDGSTALMIAALKGHIEIVQVLLAANAAFLKIRSTCSWL